MAKLEVKGFVLQEDRKVYLTAISGRWLLSHATPSWRIKDPDKGFQRIVAEERARKIAAAVLDQQRTLPNAIVLATDVDDFATSNGSLEIPDRAKFLVVDGQHRLYAQKFSTYEALYACVIHMGLSEVEMAQLFLEINDTQKRVPSSLRWDLVRLVRPEDDPAGIGAAEMVYLLANEEESPLFQRVDLTGEQPEIQIKQGSLAPELKRLIGRQSSLRDLSFEQQHRLILQFLLAVRDLDSDGWARADSRFYKARVLRAFLRLIPDVLDAVKKDPNVVDHSDFTPFLGRIDAASLDPEVIRAAQGNAGIRAMYTQMKSQIFELAD